jgi:glycosyltransferase involved in cell wall biosynthesis
VSAGVTVVIPTRDRPSLLADALASVEAQQRRAAHTIVVDDGSAEPPLPAAASVQVLRHPRALGVAAARNGGLEQVETEWVAFLDDDDLWAPGKLDRQLAVAAAERADFVWCGVVVVDARRRPVGIVAAADPGALLPRLLRTNAIGSPSAVLVRTELVRAVGGFDEELALLADWDLWLRLAAAGRGAASPELLVAYTEHAGNMTVAAHGGVARELARMAEKHAPLLRRYGGRLGGAELERWNVGGRRRSGSRLGAARDYLVAGVRGRDAGSLLRAPAALLGERLVLRLRARHVAARVGDTAWLEPYRRPEAAAAPIAPAA